MTKFKTFDEMEMELGEMNKRHEGIRGIIDGTKDSEIRNILTTAIMKEAESFSKAQDELIANIEKAELFEELEEYTKYHGKATCINKIADFIHIVGKKYGMNYMDIIGELSIND